MKLKKLSTIILFLTSTLIGSASHKVYVIHGYAGFGLQMKKIHSAITKAGYQCENYTYPSFTKDIDSVGRALFEKIRNENIDSVSFVIHSMGALAVRSMYRHLNSEIKFPFIYRFVMIAPPNKGTPVADFISTIGFLKSIGGPNVRNLTTDPQTGAERLPIPTCEVGLILGITGRKTGYNPFLIGDNDGYVLPERAKLGIEKDIAYVKADHTALTQSRKVILLSLSFLKKGTFKL